MNTFPTSGPDSRPNSPRPHPWGEDTLRLIAGLSAPEGMTDRVKAGLRTAPQTGRSPFWHSFLWPSVGWTYAGFARGAAAAAIVCVVAGGGWRICSRVQLGPSANVIVLPSPSAPQGSGFTSSKATRVPQTLDGPVLQHPVPPVPEVNVVDKMAAQPKSAPGATLVKKKRHSRPAVLPAH